MITTRKIYRLIVFSLLFFAVSTGRSQTFIIPGGPLPTGTTTCFPVNVSGIFTIYPPGWAPFAPFIDNVTINIQTTHPQTLSISLVSPSNDTLLLSAFNGAGGSNYTNTTFPYLGGNDITISSAPFTGNFSTQEPIGLSKFDFTNADGIWYLCITDTLTDTTNTSIPGPYVGSFASGTIGFGTSAGPPPCSWTMFVIDRAANVCQGDYVDLDSIYNIQWVATSAWTFNGSPVTDPNHITVSGVYSLYAYDQWGCTVTANVAVNVFTTPFVGSDQTITLCAGTPVNVYSHFNLTGANLNYQWTYNGPGSPGSYTATTAPGTYTVLAYPSNLITGTCIDTAELVINPPQILGAPITINQCSGTVDLTSLYNTIGMTVTWTKNGIPVSNPSAVNTTGIYTVGALTVDNCLLQSTVTINFTSVSLGNDLSGSICQGNTTDLTTVFGIGSLNTAWTYNNNPVLNPSAVSQPGVYTLIADDGNGCADTADFILTVNSTPSLGPNQNVNVCSGTIVNLTTVFNLTGLSAVWTYGGNLVSNPSSVTQSGSYDVTVTDANGCTGFAQVMVTYSQTITVGSNQIVDFCDGSDVDLTSLYNTGSLVTQWQLNNNPVANPSSVNAPGVYTITVTASSGCTGTAQVTLNQLASPVLSPDQFLTVCAGTIVDIAARYNTAGLTGSWTYNSLPAAPPVNAFQWGYYTITATNANGCIDSSTVFLDLYPKPNLGNDQSYIYCTGNSSTDLNSYFMLTGLTPSWSVSGLPVTNTIVNSSGAYQVIVTSADGCLDTAVVNLQYDLTPALGSDQYITLCNGDSVDITTLYNTSGMNTAWTFNSQPLTSPGFVSASGNYTLTATSGSSCTADATVHVNVTPFVNPGPDQIVSLCSWLTADLNSYFNLAGLMPVWTLNGITVQNVSAVTDTGIYILNVSDVNGCTGTAQVTVMAVACRCVADFSSNAECTEMPASFNIKADSTVISAHWDFNGHAEDSYDLAPMLKLAPSADSIPVTLITKLSCGTDTVSHKIMVRECSMACNLYFPAAFTPNDDGLNESFAPVSDCTPENYDLKILNRFGQVVFATNNISKAWDGDSENGSQNEVYVYKVNYKFPYQKSKTESGKLTLVR